MSKAMQLRVVTHENTSVDGIFDRLATELSEAQETMLDLQVNMSALCARLHDHSDDMLFKLQDADHLAQLLGDLARFTKALSEMAPESWHLHTEAATTTLHLRDLAKRLAMEEGHEHDEDDIFF